MKARNRLLLLIMGGIWIAFGVYLALPDPQVKDLPNTIQSQEAGDTNQVPGVAAFYNNYSREQVMQYYKTQFAKSVIKGFSFPTYSLNHPPIFAQQRIRQEIKVWYFEELVHPFRESYYAAGWTPALAQASLGIRYPPLYLDLYDNSIVYQKTTIRTMPTSVISRMLIYGLLTAVVAGFWYVGRDLFTRRKELQPV